MSKRESTRPPARGVWFDAEGTGHEIEVGAVALFHDDTETVDLEVELPFGELGGVLTLHLGNGLLDEIVRVRTAQKVHENDPV